MVASSTPLTVAIPALMAQALHGTPFVFEIRDPWPEVPRALGGVPRPVLAAMDRLAAAACRRRRRGGRAVRWHGARPRARAAPTR